MEIGQAGSLLDWTLLVGDGQSLAGRAAERRSMTSGEFAPVEANDAHSSRGGGSEPLGLVSVGMLEDAARAVGCRRAATGSFPSRMMGDTKEMGRKDGTIYAEGKGNPRSGAHCVRAFPARVSCVAFSSHCC